MSQYRTDAEFQLLFNRALEAIDNRVFDVKYGATRARELIPSMTGGSGVNEAKTLYTYELKDMIGGTRFIGSMTTDLPTQNVFKTRFSQRIEGIGNMVHYNRQEARALIDGSNLDIVAERLQAAQRSTAQFMDNIFAFGDAARDLKGALNHPDVTAANASTTNWAAATVDQIIEAINEPISLMQSSTLEVERPDTVLMPPTVMRELMVRRIPDTGMSLMEYIRNTFPGISFLEWHLLEAAGAGSTRRMVIMRRDEEVMAGLVPMEFRRYEPIYKGYGWDIPTEARIGGVVVRYPRAILYRDGM